MPRYFTQRSKAWIEDEEAWDAPIVANIPTVSDHEPINTGLLDSNGDAIMRAPNPCGFGKDDEW